METVVLTVHLLLALALVVVVLLQRSEGGGLGIGGGGGGLMSGRAAATALSKVTWTLGVGFVITSLALTIVAARQDGDASVLDRLGTGPAETVEPGAPDLGEDLLPPVPAPVPAPAAPGASAPPPADAPAAPPPVE